MPGADSMEIPFLHHTLDNGLDVLVHEIGRAHV